MEKEEKKVKIIGSATPTAGVRKKKLGPRRRGKYKRYAEHNTCAKNKAKRVVRSNGPEYARKWAKDRSVSALVEKYIAATGEKR